MRIFQEVLVGGVYGKISQKKCKDQAHREFREITEFGKRENRFGDGR